MTDMILAYCGLVCTECPAYLATRSNDEEKLKALALEWYGVEGDATYCLCDGCNTQGRMNKFCSECGVRACAVEHAVPNCAHCVDYGCERLTAFFQDVPSARQSLESIRASL